MLSVRLGEEETRLTKHLGSYTALRGQRQDGDSVLRARGTNV